MRPKDFKGRCTKKKLEKCTEVAKLYDKVQIAAAALLDADPEVKEIRCNVLLEGLEEGDFTSDFVCITNDGDYMIRECVWQSKLCLPRTAKLLDASRNYWKRRGIENWGIIIDKEGE